MAAVWGVMQPTQRSLLKRGPPDSDASATAASAFSATSGASTNAGTSPMKKMNDGVVGAAPPAVSGAPPPPTAMDIRAFGLEDRAEAVIAHGSSAGWSLANLAKWRRESLGGAQATVGGPAKASASSSSAAFLKQRQRAYRQQMLTRGASASSFSASSPASS